MINYIWYFMIAIGVVLGIANGNLEGITQSAMDSATLAVQMTIGFIGIWALWLGLMKVAEKSGSIEILTRILSPITRRLFPQVPRDHPAMGAMLMNMAANMMGLGNARSEERRVGKEW